MIKIAPRDLSHPDWNSMHVLYNEYTGENADPELGIGRVIYQRTFRSVFVPTLPTCSRGGVGWLNNSVIRAAVGHDFLP